MKREARPLVAIVGRPNVGKSTLFNRLVGRRAAIVEDAPGVTRDRHYADATFEGRDVTLIDTGGFVPESKEDPLAGAVRLQAQLAVEECDVVVFVVDGKEGLSPGDEEVARYLRTQLQKKPLLLAVNKVDDAKKAEVMEADFHRLGLGEPLGLSAEHGRGVGSLERMIAEKLPPAAPAPEEPEEEEAPEAEQPIRVAIVGRPNVGKSTLVNALLALPGAAKTPRMLVSPIAGTTRDPIDSELTHKGQRYVLTDTAGIRRKSAIAQKVEQFSVFAAIRQVETADVVALVLDATEPAVEQDLRIAGLAEEKGRALLLVVNKWDTQKGELKEADARERLKRFLTFAQWAPVVFVSAKHDDRVEKVLEVARFLHQQQQFRAPTPHLNKLLDHVTEEHPAPIARGKPLRLYYVAQVGTEPIAFAFMCNNPEQVPEPYRRYLANQLRSTFDLKVPIRLFFRRRPGKGPKPKKKR